MRLVCPKCASQYEVDASLFPAEGREVQCSNCEETWTQYPEEERAPVRLEPAMAAPAPARPSERLPESERAELARAVTAERAVRDGAGTTTVPHSDSDEDEDIVAALREHIAAEGTDFDGGPVRSGRRDLRSAARNVGIEVADEPEEEQAKQRRWNVSGLDSTPKEGRRKRHDKQDGLAQALRELEDSGTPRRGGGLKWGFRTAVLLVLAAAGIHAARAPIAEAYPPARPWLERYADAVTDARTRVEALYVAHGAPAVAEVSALAAGLAGGEGAPPAE